jgi:glycosyltransferase involved in cell wall biosynthesis
VNLRVGFIVGDDHTLHCGVKDYARRLADSLAELDVHAEVWAPRDWSVSSVVELRRKLRASNLDILHVQYPSIGFRSSLVPHLFNLMGVAKASIVTLHEFSALPRAQRFYTQLFRCTTSRLIFPSRYERLLYNCRLGDMGVPQVVVPIGSNVPSASVVGARNHTVLYFGQIRPNKGLEAFLELAKQSIASKRPFNFKVLGSVPGAHKGYMRSLRSAALPAMEWALDLSSAAVAETLAASFAAYLPFPDGASARRGSLLAALANGLPVISTLGDATPPELRKVLIPTLTPAEALLALDELHDDPERSRNLGVASRIYAQKYRWSSIANQHRNIYRELVLPYSPNLDAPRLRELPPQIQDLAK